MDERNEGSRIGKRTSLRPLNSYDCSVIWRLTLDLVPNSAQLERQESWLKEKSKTKIKHASSSKSKACSGLYVYKVASS